MGIMEAQRSSSSAMASVVRAAGSTGRASPTSAYTARRCAPAPGTPPRAAAAPCSGPWHANSRWTSWACSAFLLCNIPNCGAAGTPCERAPLRTLPRAAAPSCSGPWGGALEVMQAPVPWRSFSMIAHVPRYFRELGFLLQLC